MMRGGYVAVQVSAIMTGDPWTDISSAAVGGWVRLRCASELTGEPVSQHQAERMGVTLEVLAELEAAQLVDNTDGKYRAHGMPEPPRKPSDDPARIRERVSRFREAQTPHTPQE